MLRNYLVFQSIKRYNLEKKPLQISNDGKTNRICNLCERKYFEAYSLKLTTVRTSKILTTEKVNISPIKEQIKIKPILKAEEDMDEEYIESDEEILGPAIPEKKVKILNNIKLAPTDAVDFILMMDQNYAPTNAKKTPTDPVVRRHSCEVCGKKFMKKSNLIDHLRLHANMKPFQCEHCDKSFVQSGNLQAHLRTHTQERPFVCSYLGCSKTYNQSSALRIHIRSHTNEKNYVCETCEKRFTNSSDLKKHTGIHDQVKKYQCTSCEKSYAQKSHLTKHEISVHTKGLKNQKGKAAIKINL